MHGTYNEYVDAVIARLRKGWTKQNFAKDYNGNMCIVSDPKAIRWCASGAMKREAISTFCHYEDELRNRLMDKFKKDYVCFRVE
jgi:hypothetical protein